MGETKEPLKNINEVWEAAFACVQCGQCRVAHWPSKGVFSVCPVNKTDFAPNFEPFNPRGKNLILKGLLWGDLELSQELSDIMFQCSLCGACEEFCHNAYNESIDFATHRWIDQVKVYEALRADLVEAGFPLEAHIPMNKALFELLNPYGRDNREKHNWTESLDFQIKDANVEETEIIYFVGCTAALTPKIQNIAVTTSKIFHKLGVDFAIFGEKEICCGSVAMRTGDRKVFNFVVEKNTNLFKERKVKKIVTSCAGCYRTLKKDYGDKLNGIHIMHTVEFLDKVLSKKELSLRDLNVDVTYHDPCHIGRHMEMYEIPRHVLRSIASIVEIKSNKNSASCCGAGGGVRKGFPELSLEMAKNRIKDIEEIGVKYLVSTCPFCYRNLSDAIDVLESDIKMLDLVELVSKSLDIS